MGSETGLSWLSGFCFVVLFARHPSANSLTTLFGTTRKLNLGHVVAVPLDGEVCDNVPWAVQLLAGEL